MTCHLLIYIASYCVAVETHLFCNIFWKVNTRISRREVVKHVLHKAGPKHKRRRFNIQVRPISFIICIKMNRSYFIQWQSCRPICMKYGSALSVTRNIFLLSIQALLSWCVRCAHTWEYNPEILICRAAFYSSLYIYMIIIQNRMEKIILLNF